MYVIEQFVQIVHMPAQDRRITKTRKAIYSAFLQLLNQKGYETITVQEIIDLADVGRSTSIVITRVRNYYWMNSVKNSFTTCLNVLNTSHLKTT